MEMHKRGDRLDNTTTWAWWVVLLASTLLDLTGCTSLKDRSMDDLRSFRDGAVQTAQDLNATLVFQTHYSGKSGLYYNQEGGLDTGISASATFVIMPDDNSTKDTTNVEGIKRTP